MTYNPNTDVMLHVDSEQRRLLSADATFSMPGFMYYIAWLSQRGYVFSNRRVRR